MELNLKEQKNTAIINMKGDLDYNSYKEFNKIVSGLIDIKTQRIILEMANVTHIDSMGLGAITKLWKTADQLGLSIVLAAVPKNIHNMIKLVNLDRRILIFENVEAALS